MLSKLIDRNRTLENQKAQYDRLRDDRAKLIINTQQASDDFEMNLSRHWQKDVVQGKALRSRIIFNRHGMLMIEFMIEQGMDFPFHNHSQDGYTIQACWVIKGQGFYQYDDKQPEKIHIQANKFILIEAMRMHRFYAETTMHLYLQLIKHKQ